MSMLSGYTSQDIQDLPDWEIVDQMPSGTAR